RRVANALARKHLESATLLEQRMLGQEHAAHSARADLVEQLIAAEKETAEPPVFQLLVLPRGNQSDLQQLVGERPTVRRRCTLRAGAVLLERPLDLRRLEQLAAPQHVQKFVEGDRRHTMPSTDLGGLP